MGDTLMLDEILLLVLQVCRFQHYSEPQVITCGARSSFLNNGSGLRGDAFENLYLQNYMSDLHAVFTEWQVHSIKGAYNWICLIWRVTLAGSACRVNGVKIGR